MSRNLALLLAFALLLACTETEIKVELKNNATSKMIQQSRLAATPPRAAVPLDVGAPVLGMDVLSPLRLVLTGDGALLYLALGAIEPLRYDADGADVAFFRSERYAFVTVRREDRRVQLYHTNSTTPPEEPRYLPGEAAILDVALSPERRDLWVLNEGGLLQRHDLYSLNPLDGALGPWPDARGLVMRGAEVLVLTDSGLWAAETGAQVLALEEPLDAGRWEPCHGRFYGRAEASWVAIDSASGEVAHRGEIPGAGRGIFAGPTPEEVWLGGEEGLVGWRFTPAPLVFTSVPPQRRVQAGSSWSYIPQTNQSGPGCTSLLFEVDSALPLVTGYTLSLGASCDQLGAHEVTVRVDDGRGPVEQTFTLEVFDADDDGDGALGCDDACPDNPAVNRPEERDRYGDPCLLDEDADGLLDDDEVVLGSDPRNADSDGDGLLDSQEPHPDADPDGDGLINILDPDSDNDGLTDAEEVNRYDTDPEDRDSDSDAFLDGEETALGFNPLDPNSPPRSFRAAQKPVDEAACSAAAPAGRRSWGGLGGALLALAGLLARARR